MELKDYQLSTLEIVKRYLQSLSKYQTQHKKLLTTAPELAVGIDAPILAWKEIKGSSSNYNSKTNGLGENLPNFCLKVPTGGGKTLLATHTIDLINTHLRYCKTGFVLWIVPTTQIYRQTLASLRDREHPYRQVLDLSSGGRTQIIEKMDYFNAQDIEEKLVIMLLMLPSANRKTKETLRIFRDRGGFEDFFPPEDHYEKQEELLNEFPNLDYFGGEEVGLLGFQPKQIKTSLGNVLKKLRPTIIVDEGQKAYSDGAQKTIRGFNPSIVVELSATPPSESNKLVEIFGRDLDKEEMIKLDLHVTNKSSGDWKDTIAASVEKREEIERIALNYQAESQNYIRPISLIQVERTGGNQRGKGFIHSEDVKEYLIKERNIPEEQIAIKSSDTDDIEGINLYDRECPIRYIITKSALQEGWDCSFAYVLTILTNPTSKNGLTQLVGRILRQPKATKTKIQDLDESYVYCYQQKADNLLKSIKTGLEGEGLGDLSSKVVGDIDNNVDSHIDSEVKVKVREKFKKYDGKVYLPRFLYQDVGEVKWREVSYEMDILSRINWSEVSLNKFDTLSLSSQDREDMTFDIGLSEYSEELITPKSTLKVKNKLHIDTVMITRHISNVVPNPWVAHELAQLAMKKLKERYSEDDISTNQAFITEELKKSLEKERDRLSENVFKNLIYEKKILFLLEERKGKFPGKLIKVKRKAKKLVREDAEAIQNSLIEPVIEEDFNELEKSVAVCLDTQENLLWWYRNISRVDYSIQGWKKHKIFPDFLVAKKSQEQPDDYNEIYVIETKGEQLVGNLDTQYKKDVFNLCNELGKKTSWNALGLEFIDKKFVFQLISEDEWESDINSIFK